MLRCSRINYQVLARSRPACPDSRRFGPGSAEFASAHRLAQVRAPRHAEVMRDRLTSRPYRIHLDPDGAGFARFPVQRMERRNALRSQSGLSGGMMPVSRPRHRLPAVEIRSDRDDLRIAQNPARGGLGKPFAPGRFALRAPGLNVSE